MAAEFIIIMCALMFFTYAFYQVYALNKMVRSGLPLDSASVRYIRYLKRRVKHG